MNTSSDGPTLDLGDVTPGSVEFVYNSLGLPGRQTVNATSSVSYTYDNLLLSAGATTLGRSASTGQVKTLTLGDKLSYESFGDLARSTTLYDGTDEVYAVVLSYTVDWQSRPTTVLDDWANP